MEKELWALSPGMQVEALSLIAEAPRLEHTATLIAALQVGHERVREQAIQGLAALASAQPRLMMTARRLLARRVASDPSPAIKRLAATVLGSLSAGESCLRPGPTSTDPGPQIRRRRRVAPPVSRGPTVTEGEDQAELRELYSDNDEEVEPLRPESLAGSGLGVGPTEALVTSFIELLRSRTRTAYAPRVGHSLDPDRLRLLRAQLGAFKGASRSPKSAEFMERHGLSLRPDEPAVTLDDLALRAWLRLHGEPVVPGEISEMARHQLLAALGSPPGDLLAQERVILGFYEIWSAGPPPLRATLLTAAWHPGWNPLGLWLAERSFELPAWRGGGWHGAQLTAGSTLVQRNILLGQRLMLSREARLPPGWRASEGAHGVIGETHEQARVLISCGGGTLQSLEYPSFRVVSREVLVDTDPERGARLREVLGGLGAIHQIFSASRDLFEEPREGAPHPLRELFSRLQPALWSQLNAGERRALESTLQRSAMAFLCLRRLGGVTGRASRHQLVSFWASPEAPDTMSRLRGSRAHCTVDQQIEAVVMALLTELHQPHTADRPRQAALKELLIEAARTLAACYSWEDPGSLDPADPAVFLRTVNALLRSFDHAPLELAQALGLDPQQGLPQLRGGADRSLEATYRRLLRDSRRGRRTRGEASTYECRVIPHREALDRGTLGRDCSSRSVPLRALSPHHVYYGIFDEKGEQQPGYLAVHEAWGTPEHGEPEPVLCLETINEPRNLLGGAQQDLLVIFEAIARSRGLAPGLVLIRNWGTWNYANGRELACCRRALRGSPVWLSPADPVSWRLYSAVCVEAHYYSAFASPRGDHLLRPGARLHAPMVRLAPCDPVLDQIQPENLAEASRLASLPPRTVEITCRDACGPLGFISG
jgi:hypothetical protein